MCKLYVHTLKSFKTEREEKNEITGTWLQKKRITFDLLGIILPPLPPFLTLILHLHG